MIESTTILKRSATQMSCALDEEFAILDLNTSQYIGIQGVGAQIWQDLEQPRSVTELCESVSHHFDITPEGCKADVVQFLRDLQKAGLVQEIT